VGYERSRHRNPDAPPRLSLLLPAATLLTTRMAAAELPPIEWRAPAGCGTQAELTLAVGRLLRADTSDVIHDRFLAEVAEESVGRWKLTLQGFSHRGNWKRTLTGVTCIELREAATVMIALAIEPARAAAIVGQSETTYPFAPSTIGPPLGSAPSVASTDPIPSVPQPTATEPSTPPLSGNALAPPIGPPKPAASTGVMPTRAAGVAAPYKTKEPYSPKHSSQSAATLPASGIALIARTGVATGVLPDPTPMLELGGLLGFGHLQLAGYVGWLVAQTAYSSADPGKGARVQLGFAAAEVGYAWLQRPLELNAHVGLQGGAMHGVSKGVDGGSSGLGPYSSVSAGFAMTYPARGRWSAVLSADGWVSYVSPGFDLSGVGRVYEPGLLGGVFGLGLRARLK
jgi:hypothetical protein